MADRIIQRNDTAANWETINPILAMGELGIVIDGAKGYKIGDGVTTWNDLPYPANPSNIVQTTGNSETAVMSQKAVSGKLAELESQTSFVKANSADYTLTIEANNALIIDGEIKTGYDGYKVWRLEGNIINFHRKFYIDIDCYGQGFHAIYIFNKDGEVIGESGFLLNSGYMPRGKNKVLVDLAWGYNDVAYILINSNVEPAIYTSAFPTDSEPSRIEEKFDTFVNVDFVESLNEGLNEVNSYKNTEDYAIELIANGKFLSKNGQLIDNPDYRVYKLSGKIVDLKRSISFKEYVCCGQGMYLVTLYDSNDNIIGQLGELNLTTLVGGTNDIVIDLINYHNVSYILLNTNQIWLSRVKIEISRYSFDSRGAELAALSKTVETNESAKTAKETNDYSWELYAEKKLIMEDGSLSVTDYDGFNVYKLSGTIVEQRKKIMLNNLYNGGLGIWLVGIYDNTGESLGTTGFMLDTNGIDRGYNDIVVDLSFNPKYNNASYILVSIRGHNLPSVMIDRYNNNAQMYSDNIQSMLDNVNKGLNVGKLVVVKKNGVIGVDCDFTKIKDAVDFANQFANTTIIVSKGVYDIIEEFGDGYMSAISESDNNYKGLILGNGVKIIGQGYGVKLTAHYQGNNDFAKGKFSIFNIKSDFYIENLELEATNVRYCVHEDNPLQRNDYNGVYRNVKMTHYGTNGTYYTSVMCLGGGCVGNTITLIEGCEFNNAFELNTNPVSYHNTSVAGEIAQVIVKDCYFHGTQTFQTWVFQPNGSEIECYLCGNKFGAKVSYLGGVGGLVRSKEFRNEIKETDD
jgi:hypothetical protein